ncbi:MAG: response regulator [Flavobacteriales bacterium]|jgi:DNA-binding LytR/AlgR family response regulator|nr:response regulator [Flavobacteriales bacterium]
MSMQRARLLVVEDEPLIAADMQAMLEEMGHDVVGVTHNGTTAIALAQQEQPDLALLDIRLHGDPDGIEVAKELTHRLRIPFLFITSHADPATLERVKATKPEGFVIKPFEAADLRAQITIALARIGFGTAKGHLLVRDKGRLVKVRIDDIRYLEADDNYVVIHADGQRYALSATLNSMEERIASAHFVRIHRSYLVDARRITALSEKEVLIEGERLPLGRTHKEAVRAAWVGR